jgi:hypothetical protein
VNIFFLFVSSAAAICACILSLQQLIKALKKRWVEDVQHAKALRENTAAILEMTTQVRSISAQIDNHEGRLERLERGPSHAIHS